MQTVPISLVLDTNVVLDLLHFADPGVAPIQRALAARRAQCHVSDDTLAELLRVLGYPEFKLAASAQAAMYARYQAAAVMAVSLSSHTPLPRCRDPDDQMFLQLAAAVRADFLVSKDRALLELSRHRALGFAIVTPVALGVRLRDMR
jgi:putative PIN family toxin of toxin-antitoxin system